MGMPPADSDAFASGFVKLMGSQIFLRLATFGLNQVVTKILSVESFGLMSICFHLINTMILMIGREGFRRGCLRARQDDKAQLSTRALLSLASFAIPLGLTAALPILWAFRVGDESVPGYGHAILLQGLAAVIELLSEPLYILGQARMQISLRVYIEAAATMVKVLATISLLLHGGFAEAVSISLAQVLFAVTILVGYAAHFWPEWRHLRVSTSRSTCSEKQDWNRNDLTLCASFSAQAVEKLALAEGTKVAMTWVQSAYQQGIYGLVVNLGSIAARTILQPFEEAAFLAFSQPGDPGKASSQKLDMLIPLIRLAILFGGFAVAFGANNTYPALHLLYGAKYSQTEAPSALAWYCGYMLLLAVNGILEAFVHATAKGKQLSQGHVALIVINVAQTMITLPLVTYSGTMGMLAADGLGMLLRIAYCIHFIAFYSTPDIGTPGGSAPHRQGGVSSGEDFSGGKPKTVDLAASSESLSRASKWRQNTSKLLKACPQQSTLLLLCSAFAMSAVSSGVLFGRGVLGGVVGTRSLSFGKAFVMHSAGQALLLAVVAAGVYNAERTLISDIKTLRRKQE